MRNELLHPLFIHFPIALLTVGAVLRAIAIPARKRPSLQFFRATAWTTLTIGILFAWVAVGTGIVAEPLVRPDLCKPSILDWHMSLGWSTASLFSGTLFLDFMSTWFYHKIKPPSTASRVFPAIVIFLYLASLVVIIYTGTLGSSLVYNQGAAVEEKCTNQTEEERPSE